MLRGVLGEPDQVLRGVLGGPEEVLRGVVQEGSWEGRVWVELRGVLGVLQGVMLQGVGQMMCHKGSYSEGACYFGRAWFQWDPTFIHGCCK